MAEPLTESQYRSLAQFRHALRRFQRFSEEAARTAGLTPSQHQLLLAVRGFEGPSAPSMTEIGEALQLQLHSAGELVARAEANGLVERAPDAADRRRTLVHLTTEGNSKLEGLSFQHRDELRRFRREMNDVLRELH